MVGTAKEIVITPEVFNLIYSLTYAKKDVNKFKKLHDQAIKLWG